jgi:hypothetical protein
MERRCAVVSFVELTLMSGALSTQESAGETFKVKKPSLSQKIKAAAPP